MVVRNFRWIAVWYRTDPKPTFPVFALKISQFYFGDSSKTSSNFVDSSKITKSSADALWIIVPLRRMFIIIFYVSILIRHYFVYINVTQNCFTSRWNADAILALKLKVLPSNAIIRLSYHSLKQKKNCRKVTVSILTTNYCSVQLEKWENNLIS